MKIFISHISEEKNLAIVFKEWIETTFLGQLSVFVSSDPESIPAGNKWRENITSALQESKLLIILYSPLSKSRPWINFEAGCGWIKNIPIIPICHSGLKPNQIGEPISSFHGLEMEDKNFSNKFFGAIAKHSGFDKHPKIDKNHFLKDIKKSLKTFEYTINQPDIKHKYTSIDKTLTEPDILSLLTSYLNHSNVLSSFKAINYSNIDEELNIPQGSTKQYIKQIVQRWHYYPVHEGETYITFEHRSPPPSKSRWMDGI